MTVEEGLVIAEAPVPAPEDSPKAPDSQLFRERRGIDEYIIRFVTLSVLGRRMFAALL